MLDTETKLRLDQARDILVGKVPDPKSQVEQITIAMIYKFMDDMDEESVNLGGKRKFFAKDFAKYSWSNILTSNQGGHEMLALYDEGISKMQLNPGVPDLFRSIFKNAYLPYKDPETLKAFLKVINEFKYDHSEKLGDAFEYLLSILGSQGEAGQFRTPRHIIDFVVELAAPQKTESILDPACGTAGFLISSFKYISRNNTDKKGNSTLTPDDKSKLAKSLKGYDIDPMMARLSLANLYLHGFVDPQVHEYDTLTSDQRWNERADVILANPPFMTPKGGIRPHSRFSIESKKSEVLFLDYILEHLNPDGRAVVIVPEGIHFVSSGAYTQLRQKMLNDRLLLADITLPHGVFKPYASVITHILIIDSKLAKKTDDVLFIEIENDGFSQGDTREKVEGSQLNEAAKCFSKFKESILSKSKWSHTPAGVRYYAISRAELLKGKDSHIIGRWHDLPNRVSHKPGTKLKKLGDICTIEDGKSPNMATLPGEFTLVVPAEERKTADHFDFRGEAVCIPLVSSAGHGKADIKRLHYQEGEFALADTMCALFIKDKSVVIPRYLFLYLSDMCREILVPLMHGATNVTMKSSQLGEVQIPIPPVKQQLEIIEQHLAKEHSAAILKSAEELGKSSSDPDVKSAVKTITAIAAKLLGKYA